MDTINLIVIVQWGIIITLLCVILYLILRVPPNPQMYSGQMSGYDDDNADNWWAFARPSEPVQSQRTIATPSIFTRFGQTVRKPIKFGKSVKPTIYEPSTIPESELVRDLADWTYAKPKRIPRWSEDF